MINEHDILREWLTEWAERECFRGGARRDLIHRAWRSYWRVCARHGQEPLPVKKWTAAVRAVTGGAVRAERHEGEACLLSENCEVVRDALQQTAKRKKANHYRARRGVAR